MFAAAGLHENKIKNL